MALVLIYYSSKLASDDLLVVAELRIQVKCLIPSCNQSGNTIVPLPPPGIFKKMLFVC